MDSDIVLNRINSDTVLVAIASPFILLPSAFILYFRFNLGKLRLMYFWKEPMARDLRDRTKAFALRIINLYSALPSTSVAQVLGKQILRSGTSVGAHYREAHRARSTAEFVSKINGGLQELEETGYWLELIGESGTLTVNRLTPLTQEPQELIAIFVTLIKNAKSK